MNSKEKGAISEDIACSYLLQKGYKLIGRNYRTRFGELDLIMFDPAEKSFVFVEVKSLANENTIAITQTISRTKSRKLKLLAKYWIETKIKKTCQWRIDFIGIVLDNIDVVHIQSAIY